MFDVGFSEIVVIGVVALIVVGPERLPKVARTVGHLLGRMQRYVNDVKADISREMELDDLRKLQTDMHDAARSFETSVHKELGETEQALNQSIAPLAEQTPPAAPATGAAAAASPPAEALAPPAPDAAGESYGAAAAPSTASSTAPTHPG
jgi:sec-independent protein translocase protein TatB